MKTTKQTVIFFLFSFLVISLQAQLEKPTSYLEDGDKFELRYSGEKLIGINTEEIYYKIEQSKDLYKIYAMYEGEYDKEHIVISSKEMLFFLDDENPNEVSRERAYKVYDLVFEDTKIKEISWKRKDKITNYAIVEKIQFEWEEDNIIKITKTDFAGSNLQTQKAYYNTIISEFTYSDKLNPLKTIGLAGLFYFEFSYSSIQLPPVISFSKNVAISEKYSIEKKGKITKKAYEYNPVFNENGNLLSTTPDLEIELKY